MNIIHTIKLAFLGLVLAFAGQNVLAMDTKIMTAEQRKALEATGLKGDALERAFREQQRAFVTHQQAAQEQQLLTRMKKERGQRSLQDQEKESRKTLGFTCISCQKPNSLSVCGHQFCATCQQGFGECPDCLKPSERRTESKRRADDVLAAQLTHLDGQQITQEDIRAQQAILSRLQAQTQEVFNIEDLTGPVSQLHAAPSASSAMAEEFRAEHQHVMQEKVESESFAERNRTALRIVTGAAAVGAGVYALHNRETIKEQLKKLFGFASSYLAS